MANHYGTLKKEELIVIVKELEEELRYRSKEADELKESFLTNVSHEIRTPMNAIIGFSGLLKDKLVAEEEKDMFINGIIESSQKLMNTIDNIVQAARIESNQIKIKKVPCLVQDMMNGLCDSYENIKGNIGKGHISIKLAPPINKEISILTDAILLKQVLSNLIDNALKFTENGHVEVGYELLGDTHIHFYVKDTGIGIPDSKFKMIFEKFRQVEGHLTKKYSGLGVGLFNSYRLIRLLGGDMGVKSSIGIGSKFFFKLPVNLNLEKETPKEKSLEIENLNLNRILKPKTNGSKISKEKISVKNLKSNRA